jgi:4-hydroxyphenylpyruvate dioxygenase
MNEFCPIKRFDHLVFYVGNAKQTAFYYSKGFGFTQIAYRGLETGDREVTSYVMEQGDIRLVFTSALAPEHPIAQKVRQHGDHVAVIALEVPDAVTAFRKATNHGAIAASEPTAIADSYGLFHFAAIRFYGDVRIEFIDRSQYRGPHAPGFSARCPVKTTSAVGLRAIDHLVGNVATGTMDDWVNYLARSMGFELLGRFDEGTIATDYSALTSQIMQDSAGIVTFPINEPAISQRKSQIEEYLQYHGGPGVQHIALETENIIETVGQLREAGVEFLPIPDSYYRELPQRVGEIEESIEDLAKLGILVDRDGAGYLLQIFTYPVLDRPTFFWEIIQRRGARGFGEGNFQALFEAIEREQARRGNL